jgi:hypothetical protein
VKSSVNFVVKERLLNFSNENSEAVSFASVTACLNRNNLDIERGILSRKEVANRVSLRESESASPGA